MGVFHFKNDFWLFLGGKKPATSRKACTPWCPSAESWVPPLGRGCRHFSLPLSPLLWNAFTSGPSLEGSPWLPQKDTSGNFFHLWLTDGQESESPAALAGVKSSLQWHSQPRGSLGESGDTGPWVLASGGPLTRLPSLPASSLHPGAPPVQIWAYDFLSQSLLLGNSTPNREAVLSHHHSPTTSCYSGCCRYLSLLPDSNTCSNFFC